MLIACGASEEVDINWPVLPQPPARMGSKGQWPFAAGGLLGAD
jgi:hypothetical protein